MTEEESRIRIMTGMTEAILEGNEIEADREMQEITIENRTQGIREAETDLMRMRELEQGREVEIMTSKDKIGVEIKEMIEEEETFQNQEVYLHHPHPRLPHQNPLHPQSLRFPRRVNLQRNEIFYIY